MTFDGRPAFRLSLAAVACLALLAAAASSSATVVYKWVDASGTVHLSSSKPPPGVSYQVLDLGSYASGGARAPASGGSGKGTGSSQASPAQTAQRSEVLASLRNRECVIALEGLDRLTSGARPTSTAEITRLKQTADANCSRDPSRRRDQEEMAAKLRVANGADCVRARNTLADMTAKRVQATPEQLRAQRTFVDAHCIAPVQ